MPRRVRIQPYKPGSNSAAALSRATNKPRLKVRGNSRFRLRPTDVIVNWGNPRRMFADANYLNAPERVEVAQSKRASLEVMREAGVRVPDFTTNREEVLNWDAEKNTKSQVVCRTLDRANAGRGITLYDPNNPNQTLPQAGLYTKYVKKRHEYRVHIWKGEVLDVQQKRREHIALEQGEVNSAIRNYANGWVFCRTDVEAPQDVITQSKAAVAALGLDFGAVDVGFNEHYGEATVYEVNTAPGLENTTLDKYATKIRALRYA